MAYFSSSNKLMFFFSASLLLFLFSTNFVAGESDKVKLNLYYESLCPYCHKFITNDLVKFFKSDLHRIADLKLVPFGNAKVSDNLTVTCQHGEEECKLNAIAACAIRTWPNPKMHYWFIRCVEKNTKNWGESCFKTYGGEKAIRDCYAGDLSKKLILGYAKQTLNLKPKKKYVPWVTVNGTPLYDNYDDFVAQVCKAYNGKAPLPKLCYSSASAKKKALKLQVSYANEAFHY
ncbi:Gamma interferon responsive lysosomal thiol (GILT) reductase family protein [Raphanus sativus]|uniref:Gamma-interferon-responsive lysosomal thiol protein n=1 Tax=Raphanus sativus TaxID=3726 RepID=A0A6J0L359_RAPSA|nr:gamma-interferon-responsive lysosomal thiol protein [Raphanus sativus]KAJ4875800.1 Gamma interferon responsive lysosomal thiol (GILT) reductase family protein [Raphanus sativus]